MSPPSLKDRLLALMPPSILSAYRRAKRGLLHRRDAARTPEEVFTEIYRRGRWGGEGDDLCSGGGSVDGEVVDRYVVAVGDRVRALGLEGKAFVDLGCGDFRVGQRLRPLAGSYLGVDIVPEVVARNAAAFADAKTSFRVLNMIADPLPPGDVCFVRQVLQHLSNAQIEQILGKLERYPFTFITEHYPSDHLGPRPNLDKVHGEGIRLYENSGVYLDQPPFEIPRERLELVLEVPGHGFEGGIDPGVIRTFLLRGMPACPPAM